MFFKRKGKQGRRGSHQAASRCWGLQDKASRHQQVKRPEGGQQQVDTTAEIDNAWATGTHFSLKCYIFCIVTSSREPGLTELIFPVAFLFHLPPCRWYILRCLGTAGNPSFAMLSLRWKFSKSMFVGHKTVSFTEHGSRWSRYRDRWDRASEGQIADQGALCTKHTHCCFCSLKVRRRTS